jgi:hypothetical protein
MKTYDFQINQHFGAKNSASQVSACNLKFGLTWGRSLSAVFKRIKNRFGLKSEQITLSFQPCVFDK